MLSLAHLCERSDFHPRKKRVEGSEEDPLARSEAHHFDLFLTNQTRSCHDYAVSVNGAGDPEIQDPARTTQLPSSFFQPFVNELGADVITSFV